MRRWLLLGIVIAVLAMAGGAVLFFAWRERTPILVGLLHSKTGPWAIVEQSMLEAELLAIDEINAAGGLLGRPVRGVVADGRSDGPTFALEAQRLIHGDKVSVIIGCWTSDSRKFVRPVVEGAQHLLIYPPSYEGLEESTHIAYIGGPANQQVIPTVSWCHDVRKAKKFFLVGTDSLWARAVATVVKDQLYALRAELAGEAYLGTGEGRTDVVDAVARIERAKPDVVISTVDVPENAAFYGRLRHAGITPDRIPVVSFSLNEEGVRRIPIADVVGQYAGWNYIQGVARAENQEFVRKFRGRYGPDRVITDNIQVAYESVRIWAQTVLEAETDDVATVNGEIVRQSVNSASGIVTVDSENRHGWRPFYLGRVRPDGQFEVAWSLTRSIRPIPYPASRTREQWDAYIDELTSGWVGPASRSAPDPALSTGAAIVDPASR